MKHTRNLWITSLLLGLAFDLLFWKKIPGISFFLFCMLCLTGVISLLHKAGLRAAKKSYLLLIPIVFLAVMTFIRAEPLTLGLNYLMVLGLMALFAMSYAGGRWLEYGLVDYVGKFFHLVGSMLALPLTTRSDADSKQNGASSETGAKKYLAILRGLALALPFIFIFAALFAAGDMVFAEKMGAFIDLFKLENLPEYILRGMIILLAAYALAGFFLHAARNSHDKKLMGIEKPIVKPFLGFSEAAIVLTSVNVLFVLFVAVQFRYFFFGRANIILEGFTYAEYARRGFGEMTGAACISLLLIAGLSAITKREKVKQIKWFSALAGGLVLLVLVVLYSAFQRLLLYEYAYGFTRARTYAHVFMVWLGLALAAVMFVEMRGKIRFFTNILLAAALGFVVALNILNVDAFIVKRNIQRTKQGMKLHASYLTELSEDTVPALAALYVDPSLDFETREAVGATLACMHYEDKGSEQKMTWQSYHFSRQFAVKILDGMQAEFTLYKIYESGWEVVAESPSGEVISCSQWWD